jgi:hypothetical protein
MSSDGGAHVVFLVSATVAQELSGRRPAGRATVAIKKALQAHGARLRPTDEAIPEDDGREYWSADAPQLQVAEQVASSLRNIDGVVSAYVKPRTSLP